MTSTSIINKYLLCIYYMTCPEIHQKYRRTWISEQKVYWSFYYCIANYHKLTNPKQYSFIMSEFLQVRSQDNTTSLQLLYQLPLQCHLRLDWGGGGINFQAQFDARIHFLAAVWYDSVCQLLMVGLEANPRSWRPSIGSCHFVLCMVVAFLRTVKSFLNSFG